MVDFRRAVEKILDRNDLDEDEAFRVFSALSADDAISAPSAAALLTALRAKGESVPELVGAARAVLASARPFPRPRGGIVDIVGTGGDGKGTCNVSTLAALTVAAAGVPVAKHGNRSSSGKCGSADLVEALGVSLEMPEDEASARLREFSFAFLFAPYYHSGFRRIAEIRRQLGFPTIFNRIGPLTNPARPSVMLLGVAHREWLEPMARALQALDCGNAWVAHGGGGSDELDLEGENAVISIGDGTLRMLKVTAEDAGLKRTALSAIAGGSARENAVRSARVLQGEDDPLRDAVALNAGAALHLAGASGDIREGTAAALEILKKGQPWRLLEKLREK